MLLGDLIDRIEISTVLSAVLRQKCLELIPRLNKEQLKILAQNLLWLEEQEEYLGGQENAALSQIKELFAGMNLHAAKFSKKQHFQRVEAGTHQEELADAQSLLNDL